MGVDRVIREFDSELQPESIVDSLQRPIPTQLKTDLINTDFPIKFASNYLSIAKTYMSDVVVDPKNFADIQSVAQYFPSNLTSFLGFECRLGATDRRTDLAFAISGIGKDRQALVDVMRNGSLPEQFIQQQEWKQLEGFTKSWADASSALHDKIKCFWLEFDMPESLPAIPIPCVFFGLAKLPKGVSNNNGSQYEWIARDALPLLQGRQLPENLENNLMECLEKMPKNASLFQVGTMLSRSTNAIRLCVNKLSPIQILPYLNSIGWTDETGEFTSLIGELEDKADRFVIDFDVTENGIGPKVGIELSFTGNRFQNETRWDQLFDYLVEKGMCIPKKRDALLGYQGMGNDEIFSGGIMKPVTSAVTHFDSQSPSTTVRYINHVKIVYQQGQPMEAKAYPAVRLFE